MSKIEIVPYNLNWPQWFLEAKLLLDKSMGDLALSIDHIGSTSVPGLGSKNRIDIQVTVAEISDSLKMKLDEKLTLAGFSQTRYESDHRPAGDQSQESHWKKFYLSGTHKELAFRANIHFRAIGSANQVYPLLFRDYLREHAHARDTYYQLKKILADYLGDDSEAYTNAKDPGCDLIMISAREWAKSIGWKAK